MSRGNPQKIAEYKSAEHVYNDMVAEYFREEDGVQFSSRPSEAYVNEIETKAKETGDERDLTRAAILRDRLDHNASDSRKHIDWRETRQRLTSAIQSGEKITDRDVQEASKLVKQNSSVDMLVLYSEVKKTHESQKEEAVE